MLASTLLFPLGLLVTAPLTISEVSAAAQGGRLAVDIKADGMVDPEGARAKMVDGRLYLFVEGTRVRGDNRAWGEGSAEIRAHRHRNEVELVVPLRDGSCRGPVEFAKSAGGLKAFVGCEGAVVAAAGAHGDKPRRTRAAAVPEAASPPAPARQQVAAPAEPAAPSAARLETGPAAPKPARIALPAVAAKVEALAPATNPARADTPAPAARAESPASAAATAAALKMAVALPAEQVTEETRPAEKPARAATPVPAPAPATPAAAPMVATPPAAGSATAPVNLTGVGAEQRPQGGRGGMFVAAFLLAGLGAGAFFFARRRSSATRYIKIVETASLGPKRALVVAKIGGETMILGSSEAGITLLQAGASGQPVPLAIPDELGERLRSRAPAPANDRASEGGSEPEIPRGLFHALLKSRRPVRPEPVATDDFAEVLEESFEDQELRRKMSERLRAIDGGAEAPQVPVRPVFGFAGGKSS